MNNPMSKQAHYSKAPITEAIIDLRVAPHPNSSIAQLEQIQSRIQDRYPTRESVYTGEFQFSIGEQADVQKTKQEHIGYRFVSHDKRFVVQVRLDGFTLSVLPPYDTWEKFRDEARHLWNIYRAVMQPETITRIAVRYINRLDIPAPTIDFKDYLRTSPEVSPNLSQGLSSYFMQLQIPQQDLKAILVLNEAMVPPPRENMVSVLLDIDLYRDQDIPIEDEPIWALFEQLRHRKNDAFEACITDTTRELIR